jgi:hypothetical protein
MYARGRITTRAGSLNNIPTRPGNPIPTPAKIFLCMENNPYSPVFIHFKLHTEVKGRFFFNKIEKLRLIKEGLRL